MNGARSPSLSDCAKSLQGEAPCGSAVYGKVDEMSPAPLPGIDNITGKGLRTAVALSTASCSDMRGRRCCACVETVSGSCCVVAST